MTKVTQVVTTTEYTLEPRPVFTDEFGMKYEAAALFKEESEGSDVLWFLKGYEFFANGRKKATYSRLYLSHTFGDKTIASIRRSVGLL